MSQLGVQKFIALVEVHFPRAKFSGDEVKEAAWLRSMNQILGRFDEDTLIKAAEIIVTTRDPRKNDVSTMFPKPVECIEVCERVLARTKLAALPPPELEHDPLAGLGGPDARVDYAKICVTYSPFRERAQREGWLEDLFEFTLEHGGPPRTEAHIEQILSAHRARKDLLANLNVDEGGDGFRKLAKPN